MLISVFLFCFVLFYWKTVKLYSYTINCFYNICGIKYIQEKYTITIKGNTINNLRVSTFGTMYLVVVIPEEVESEYFDEYLQTYLTILEQAMVVQNLYGLVKTRKEKYLVTSDQEIKNAIFYIKFVPILYKNTFSRFICYVLVSFLSVFLINHFELIKVVLDIIRLIKI